MRDGLKYRAKPQSAPCSCLCLLVFPLPERVGGHRTDLLESRRAELCRQPGHLCSILPLPAAGWVDFFFFFNIFNPSFPIALFSLILAAVDLKAASLHTGSPERCYVQMCCSS